MTAQEIQAALNGCAFEYIGLRVHLIGGNSAESGHDVGEIIIADAVCIAYFDI